MTPEETFEAGQREVLQRVAAVLGTKLDETAVLGAEVNRILFMLTTFEVLDAMHKTLWLEQKATEAEEEHKRLRQEARALRATALARFVEVKQEAVRNTQAYELPILGASK